MMVFSVDEEGMVFPNVVWVIRQNIGHWVVLISLIVNILWDKNTSMQEWIKQVDNCSTGTNKI